MSAASDVQRMRIVVLAVVALLALAGCGSTPAPASSPADSCIGSGCSLTLAPEYDYARNPPTATLPVNVTLKLSVKSVPGDFGGYIVNLHDGNPAKQTPFTADRNGKWSKTITVPNASMVKLDIARIGATCTIATSDGQVLVTDENSCIVGS